MSSFAQRLDAASAPGSNRVIPGAVVISADKHGGSRYLHTSGQAGIKPDAPPLAGDSIMWIASCTKLMTALSCMQCVERGLLTLDDDVSPILHEFKDIQILRSFTPDGVPVYVKAKNKVTLRMLLTHSSGVGYDFVHPKLMALRRYQKQKVMALTGDIKAYETAIMFEPGEGWTYGGGIDWAGQMVERVNGGVRLGDYMKTNIWDPLDMHDTTFRLSEREDLLARYCSMTARTPDGSLIPAEGLMRFPNPKPKTDEGGSGSYSCATDYIKLLVAMLKDDGTLLKPESMVELFRPQLSETKYLQKAMSDRQTRMALVPGLPENFPWNYALGGIVAMDDVKGRLHKGSMLWGGLPNLSWWVDRKAESCGLYASQLIPPGDAKSAALVAEFQEEIYARNKRQSSL